MIIRMNIGCCPLLFVDERIVCNYLRMNRMDVYLLGEGFSGHHRLSIGTDLRVSPGVNCATNGRPNDPCRSVPCIYLCSSVASLCWFCFYSCFPSSVGDAYWLLFLYQPVPRPAPGARQDPQYRGHCVGLTTTVGPVVVHSDGLYYYLGCLLATVS